LILGGAIVTERVFAWPGIGQRIVEAILGRDYPVVQAVVLVTALLFMLINLLVDLDLHVPRSTVADVSAALGAVALLASIVRGRRRPPPLPVLTCACCALLVVAAIFGNWLAPYSKEAVSLGASLLPPAWESGGTMAHLLGTDQLGRDILSRLIAGARISLATAAAATLVSGAFGVLVGLVAGYVGGIVESIAMRIVDAFLALPFILLALALVATLGTGFGNIIMVMVIANWARYARLVRSEVLSVKQRDFVTLARIAGVRPFVIMLRHVLPNVLNSVVVLAILDVGRAIILESSLSFLGVGIQPPDVSWG
jgi:peptide/nickel transport system permease protein